MYIAMGTKPESGGTTKLHLDVTDAVNLMVWSALGDAPAATWHIFPRADALKLSNAVDVLKGREPANNTRLIHSHSVYLSPDDLHWLHSRYNIRPWVVEQRAGDMVFIPAGCPHQVGYSVCLTVHNSYPSRDRYVTRPARSKWHPIS